LKQFRNQLIHELRPIDPLASIELIDPELKLSPQFFIIGFGIGAGIVLDPRDRMEDEVIHVLELAFLHQTVHDFGELVGESQLIRFHQTALE